MSGILKRTGMLFTEPRVLAERNVTETVLPPATQLPLGERPLIGPLFRTDASPGNVQQVSGAPRFGSQIIFPPEQTTRREQIRGAPPGLQFLADFLVGFGGGPDAALRQQALRKNQLEGLLAGRERAEQRQSTQAQQEFQNRLGLAQLGLQQRRLGLDERRLLQTIEKANRNLGINLNSPTEMAAAGVLFRLGVDITDRNSVLKALAKPETMQEIAKAIQPFGKEAQGTLAERLATLRGFDKDSDPKKFADEVVRIDRSLRISDSKRSLGGAPSKSVRDQQAEFILQDSFGIQPPARTSGALRLMPGVQRHSRLKLKLSELIRFVGDEDSLLEFLDAAREALGGNATPEQVIEAVEQEVKKPKRSLGRNP